MSKKHIGIIILAVVVLAIIAAVVSFFTIDSRYLADHHFEKALTLEKKFNGDIGAMKHYKKAAKTYQAIGHEMGEMKSYIQLGLLHLKLGNVLQVEYNVLKALEIGEEKLQVTLKVKFHLLIAAISEPEKARKHIDIALAMAEKERLYPEIFKAYFILGKSYEIKADFEKAEASYQKAEKILDDFPTVHHLVDGAKIYESLGELYWGDGRADKAILYYKRALESSFGRGRGYDSSRYMTILGDIYAEKNMVAKACDFWKNAKIEEYMAVNEGDRPGSDAISLPEKCQKFHASEAQ